jgi:Tol biopolymer transport system component
MNQSDELDRKLVTWLDDPFTPPAPAYLVEVLDRTRRTRQRRSWASLERWLPVTLTLPRPMLTLPMRLLAIGLALILALLAAMALAPIMSQPNRLAATVTNWSNGLIAYGSSGDIFVVDPAGGEPRVLIGGTTTDDSPDWSPDGTRIAFTRAVGLGYAIMVADADGSNLKQVTTDPYSDWQIFMWSPDGTQLVVAGTVAMKPVVTLAAADGSGTRDLALAVPADWGYWHPDGKSLLIRAVTSEGAGLYSLNLADGVLSDPIITSDTTSGIYATDRGASDLMWPSWSPDGSHIAYTNGQQVKDGRSGVFGGWDTRNHVVAADGTGDRVVEYAADSDYEDAATWSPDGTHLSMVIRTGQYHQVAIVDMVGDTPIVATDQVSDPNGLGHVWSPDGTTILSVRDADGIAALVDPATGASTKFPWLLGPTDWQPVSSGS